MNVRSEEKQRLQELHSVGSESTQAGQATDRTYTTKCQGVQAYSKKIQQEKEIAAKKGLTPQQLSNWKYLRRDKIREALSKNQDSAPKASPIDWEKKYATDLEQYKTEITGLKKQIEALEQLKYVCEDLENESANLRKRLEDVQNERDTAMKALRERDYELENNKQRISGMNEAMSKLQRENKTMRELLKEWA